MTKDNKILHNRMWLYLEDYHNNSLFGSYKIWAIALLLSVNVFQVLDFFISNKDILRNVVITVLLISFVYNYFLGFVDFADQKLGKFQINRNKYTKEIKDYLLGKESSCFLSDPDAKEKIFHTQNFVLFSTYCKCEKNLYVLRSMKSFAYAFLFLDFFKIPLLGIFGFLSFYPPTFPLFVIILSEICAVCMCISLIILPGKRSFEAVG